MIIPFLHTVVRRQLRRHGVVSKSVSLGKQDVHYYESVPERPEGTLLLVHGLGTSSSTWIHIFPQLKKLRVLAPDLPGFGFSPAPPNVPTLEYYVKILEDFAAALVPGPYTLLGHSLGGWITIRYTVHHREQVNHLVLINPAGIFYQGVESLRDAFDLHSPRDTRVLLDHIWMRYPWYYRPFTPFVFEDLLRRHVPQIVRGIHEADFVNDDLARLTLPVSVIWGLGDRLISPEALRILEAKLPAKRIYTIRDSGHVPQLEAPAELMNILRKALYDSII